MHISGCGLATWSMDYGQQIKRYSNGWRLCIVIIVRVLPNRKRRRSSSATHVRHGSVSPTAVDSTAPVTIAESPTTTTHSSSQPLGPSNNTGSLNFSSGIEQEVDDILFSSSILEYCVTDNVLETSAKEPVSKSKDVHHKKETSDEAKDENICVNRKVGDGRTFPETACTLEEGAQSEEHLFGLYPEDFSFILDSSAVLAEEEGQRSNTERAESLKTSERALLNQGMGVSSSVPPRSPISSAVTPQNHFAPVSTLNLQNRQSLSSPSIASASTFKPDHIRYPPGTFYGLPLAVQSCLREYRGINKLYGIFVHCI